MNAGSDLVYDLRWFLFSENLFKPEPDPGLSRQREGLRTLMPCLVASYERESSEEVRQLRDNVRAKMKSMGFYKGRHQTRPSDQSLERDVIGPKPQAPKAGKGDVFLHVYASPTAPGQREVSDRECRTPARLRKRNVDCVLCVARHTANHRAKGVKGGFAIGMKEGETVAELWNKIDQKSRGRFIKELHVYGHGLPNEVVLGELLGALRISPSTRVPDHLFCRFAKDAQIALYGCKIGAPQPSAQDALMNWFGKGLLCRGGKVTAFNASVNSECGPDGLVLHIERSTSLERVYEGCDARGYGSDFLNVLDLWKQKGITLDEGDLRKE